MFIKSNDFTPTHYWGEIPIILIKNCAFNHEHVVEAIQIGGKWVRSDWNDLDDAVILEEREKEITVLIENTTEALKLNKSDPVLKDHLIQQNKFFAETSKALNTLLSKETWPILKAISQRGAGIPGTMNPTYMAQEKEANGFLVVEREKHQEYFS